MLRTARLDRTTPTNKLFPSSSASSSISSSVSSIQSSIASAHATDTSSSSSATQAAAASTSSIAPENKPHIRAQVASDLKNFQEKFAKAADKGTEDLLERIKDITDRQVENQVHGVGEALVVQLEESSKSELEKLERTINLIVTSLPKQTTKTDIEKAEEELSRATKSAGLAVRSKAQALRTWKQRYEEETRSLISAASDSTLEVIDNIADLGLQEIGMRWANMEGVTYKDWAKYHEVKDNFGEWRGEVEAVANAHGGLKKSKDNSEEVEFRGMSVAEEAAKGLVRLKEVGLWKIHANDASDDYSTKHVPPKAAAVGQDVVESMKSAGENIVGTPQGSVESIVSKGTKMAAEAASSVSSRVLDSEAGVIEQATSKMSKASGIASSQVLGSEPGVVEQATSKISEASSVASKTVSEAIADTQRSRVESVVSAASQKASRAAHQASEPVIGKPATLHESIAPGASKSVVSAASAISEAVPDPSTPLAEGASSLGSSFSSSASSVANQASNKVFSGAMAQKVGERKPLLDEVFSDDDDMAYSERLQSMVSEAGDKYADVTRAVSEALLKPTSSQGTGESVTSMATEQYSSALAAASRALHGTQQGTGESVTSVASEKYAQAVAA